MQLWQKILVSSGAVLICLIAGALMTEPLSALPRQFTRSAPAGEATSASGQMMGQPTLIQAEAHVQALDNKVQRLQASVNAQQQHAEPAVRFLYQYRSGGASSFLQTVLTASSLPDAVENVTELNSVLRQDETELRTLQQTEHALAEAKADEAAAEVQVMHIALEQGSEQSSTLLATSQPQ